MWGRGEGISYFQRASGECRGGGRWRIEIEKGGAFLRDILKIHLSYKV